MEYLYRDQAGREIGPLPLEALAKLRLAGVIAGDTLVRAANRTDWQQCRDIIADPPASVSSSPAAASPANPPALRSSPWRLSWSLFGCAVLCFLMPFFELSCEGKKFPITGQQLVTGTEVEGGTDAWNSQKKEERIPAYPAAQTAAGLCAGALILSLLRKREAAFLSAALGVGAVVALFVLKAKLEQEVATEGKGVFTLNPREGFWAVCGLLAAGAVMQYRWFDYFRVSAGVSEFRELQIPKPVRTALGIIVMVCVLGYAAYAAYASLSRHTSLSYTFSLDGKPLSSKVRPSVLVDGNDYTKGRNLPLGRHRLQVALKDAEPLERTCWVLHGAKDVGVLPLISSKGDLTVSCEPNPAHVRVNCNGQLLQEGEAPLRVQRLRVGTYEVLIQRGEYQETQSVDVVRNQLTDAKVKLKIGTVLLSATPPDADYELVWFGHQSTGKLPARIENLPVGTHTLVVRRRGWDLESEVLVKLGEITTNVVQFPYASLEVSSEPAGMTLRTNGVDAGKTPMTLSELKPSVYHLTVTDGDSEMNEAVTLSPNELERKSFVFHYGNVRITSAPPGAILRRKGKELGKTPTLLEHIPTGETTIELELAGFVQTNCVVQAREGETPTVAIKLINAAFRDAIDKAKELLAAEKFDDARKSVDEAAKVDPTEPVISDLRAQIASEETKAARKKLTDVVERAMAAAGGRETLERFKAFVANVNMNGDDSTHHYTSHLVIRYQYPDKYRVDEDTQYRANNQGTIWLEKFTGPRPPYHGSICINGADAWEYKRTMNGPTFNRWSSTDANVSVTHAWLRLANYGHLTHLLTDQCKLSQTLSTDGSPRNSNAIQVEEPDAVSTKLYFDDQSGRLIAAGWKTTDKEGQPVNGLQKYLGFKSYGVIEVPTMTMVFLNNKLIETRTVTSFLPRESLADRDLAPPNF